jgi:uncharacterized protein (AIM24 family)
MAHEIDYQVYGEEMQFVEIQLDPGESVIAEAGAMMYMDDGIKMETIFWRWLGTRRRRSGGKTFIRRQTLDYGGKFIHDGLY